MLYLKDIGLSDDEINSVSLNLKELLELFPMVVKENYEIIRELGLKNEHDVVVNHLSMLLMNPEKLDNIFSKYDRDDLIRCIEKNHRVLEKLQCILDV